MTLLQSVQVYPSGLVVKFSNAVKVSTLISDNFTLTDDSSTPVTTPFATIDTRDHYNTIARQLTLYFDDDLTEGDTYTLTVSGLESVLGVVYADETYEFTALATEEVTADIEALEPDPIEIIDRSIQSNAFINSEVIYVSNADFYVVETDPEEFELFLDTDYNSGRITIKFSRRPSNEFINSSFFKAQKKEIKRTPTKWVNVEANVSLDAAYPWVYIDFPSVDDDSVYTEPGVDYFESGYKYRVKISKRVGV